jgi:hypothetical protein
VGEVEEAGESSTMKGTRIVGLLAFCDGFK